MKLINFFLIIQIYGECYHIIYLLQKELKNIQFIQDSINKTLSQISEPEYFNQILNEKFNLSDDEKVFFNNILVEFRDNILPYFNNTIPSNAKENQAMIMMASNNNNNNSIQDQTFNYSIKNSHFNQLFLLIDYKNFNQLIDFIRTQATAYIPLAKSLLSFSYGFIFVILDSSTFLLSFILNFVSFFSKILFNHN